MSDFYAFYPHGTQQPAFDPFPKHQQHAPFNFDSASFGTDQCTAQDPQEFEDDLEAILAQAALNLEVPVLTDNTAIFEQIRGGTPTRGVPSTFTVSSESAYDSGYNENDSVYTYHSDLSALMNFQTLGVVDSDYSAASPISPHSSPSSNIGMTMPAYSPSTYSHRGSYSDYEPTHIRVPPSSASDYYPQMTVPVKYTSPVIQATVSPANVSTQLPSAHSHQATVVASQAKQENLSRAPTTKDPKRKYTCPNCPRAFARMFNLKTHIQTHDPNRSKPYACQHKSCGRAFSRKHDLTRHLISIHRSDTESVGIAGGARTRCEDCGASSSANGKAKCDCQDKK